MTAETKPMPCLRCGYPADAHTNPRDEADVPAPGNAALCLACGKVMIFDRDDEDELIFVEPTREQLVSMMDDVNLLKIITGRAVTARQNADTWPTGPIAW